MLNHCTYFPVLRWKGAEQDALKLLDYDVKERIRPIIELVPQYKKAKKEKTYYDILEGIHANWGTRPFLLDHRHFDGSVISKSALKTANQVGLFLIPVVPFELTIASQYSVSNFEKGICMRLEEKSLELLQTKIKKIKQKLSLSNIDLIIDWGLINNNWPSVSKTIKKFRLLMNGGR